MVSFFFILLMLLSISAFFSGAETALTGASDAAMHKLSADGNRAARVVEELRAKKDQVIATLLLGNNVINIFASSIATVVLVDNFGPEGVAYATIGMTVMILVFAEVLPKSYAFEHPDKVALWVAPLVKQLVRYLSPMVLVTQWLVRHVLYAFARVTGSGSERLMSEQEALRAEIDLQHQRGIMVKQDRDMLGGVLDLHSMKVEEVMIHRRYIQALDIGGPPETLLHHLLESGHTRLPVFEGLQENIIGIVHTRDVFRLWLQRASTVFDVGIVREAMLPPRFIPLHTPLSDQLHRFRDERNHVALIVDEYGNLEGLITLEDILEEIVGQIEDEHDDRMLTVTHETNGSILIPAHMTIRDLNRAMGWDLPTDHANTIGGLLLRAAGEIPDIGIPISVHSVTMEVLEKDYHRLLKIRIRPSETERSPL